VRDAEAWRWVTERAWFVDAAAYAFDLRFGPGDFSTEPRNADADDVREAIFAAIEEEAALAAVEGEGSTAAARMPLICGCMDDTARRLCVMRDKCCKPTPHAATPKHDGPCWRNSHADCGC
jgi:hypothetical protein